MRTHYWWDVFPTARDLAIDVKSLDFWEFILRTSSEIWIQMSLIAFFGKENFETNDSVLNEDKCM